jgi:hypothetical protein
MWKLFRSWVLFISLSTYLAKKIQRTMFTLCDTKKSSTLCSNVYGSGE